MFGVVWFLPLITLFVLFSRWFFAYALFSLCY